jgi:hypothetical protein
MKSVEAYIHNCEVINTEGGRGYIEMTLRVYDPYGGGAMRAIQKMMQPGSDGVAGKVFVSAELPPPGEHVPKDLPRIEVPKETLFANPNAGTW